MAVLRLAAVLFLGLIAVVFLGLIAVVFFRFDRCVIFRFDRRGTFWGLVAAVFLGFGGSAISRFGRRGISSFGHRLMWSPVQMPGVDACPNGRKQWSSRERRGPPVIFFRRPALWYCTPMASRLRQAWSSFCFLASRNCVIFLLKNVTPERTHVAAYDAHL